MGLRGFRQRRQSWHGFWRVRKSWPGGKGLPCHQHSLDSLCKLFGVSRCLQYSFLSGRREARERALDVLQKQLQSGDGALNDQKATSISLLSWVLAFVL